MLQISPGATPMNHFQPVDPEAQTPERPLARETSDPAAAPRVLLLDSSRDGGSPAALQMLRQEGLLVEEAPRDVDAALAMAQNGYALIILDIETAEGDGLDLCRRILEAQAAPVVIWSARAGPLDQVAALELGAEDVVAKKAHPLELLARIRAILRRRRVAAMAPSPPQGVRSWRYDFRASSLRSWRDSWVRLGPGSAALFRVMCERPRQKLTREDLRSTPGFNGRSLAPRTLDVAVSRMRRTLATCDHADQLIRTVRLGYLFDADVQACDGGFLMTA